MKNGISNDCRLHYVDIYKGIGIVLMVMGHIGFGDKFAYWIHAFHMPIFFFISGFCYKKRNIKETLIRKVKTLLVPYFCFGLGCYIIWGVGHLNRFSLEPLKHLLWINTDGIVICGAIWFLTALFWVDVIYAVLDKYILNTMVLSSMITVIALFGCILKSVLMIRFPWALDVAFVGLGFYHTARLLSMKKETGLFKSLTNMPLMIIVLIGSVTTVFIFLNGYVNLREGLYAVIPLFWINSFLSIWVLLCTSITIQNTKHISKKILQFMKSIGKNSIIYLCLNQLTIEIAGRAMMSIPVEGILKSLIVLIIVMASLFVCSRIFCETKLKLLIGSF